MENNKQTAAVIHHEESISKLDQINFFNQERFGSIRQMKRTPSNLENKQREKYFSKETFHLIVLFDEALTKLSKKKQQQQFLLRVKMN